MSAGQIEVVDADRKLKNQQDEEKRLAEMMIPKKKKYLYDKIIYGKKRKAREVRHLCFCLYCGKIHAAFKNFEFGLIFNFIISGYEIKRKEGSL